MRPIPFVALMTAILWTASLSHSAMAVQKAQIGQKAPDFTLTDESGKSFKLKDHLGKSIVVLEWTNPGCPYVKRHYDEGTMAKLATKYAANNVQWVAIDSSHSVKPTASKEWKTTHKLTYPILQDPTGAVGRMFGAKRTPQMFVIDRTGTVRYNGAIDDDKWGKKDTRKNYVDEWVGALVANKSLTYTTSDNYGCTVKYQKSSE